MRADDLFDAAVACALRRRKLKAKADADPVQSRATEETFVLADEDGQVIDRLPLKTVEREREQLDKLAAIKLPSFQAHDIRVFGLFTLAVLLAGLMARCNSVTSTPPTPSDWLTDGSAQAACEVALKQRLRDPDSYQQAGEFVGGPGTDGTALWRWSFRSRNGFGGMNLALAQCVADRSDKTVTVAVIDQ